MLRLSAIVLHHNRLFCLDKVIESLREHLPTGSQIIVGDDGSDPRVTRAIQHMNVDGLYAAHPGNAINTESDTMRGAYEMTRGDLVMYVEDDCLAVDDIGPAVDMFVSHKEVRMARLTPRPAASGEAETIGNGWSLITRPGKCPYTSNQPYIVRRNDFGKMGLFEQGWITRVEIALEKNARRLWGAGRWCAAPDSPLFTHIGTDRSTQLHDARQGNLADSIAHAESMTPYRASACATIHGEQIEKPIMPTLARLENPSTPSRGLGDTVAKLTKAVGIKPCPGCKKRQDKLNRLVPYRRGNVG